MIKVLFVCHGNICRSPLAEVIMKDLVHKAGLDSRFLIQSAATSDEEIGNSIYPNTLASMRLHGLSGSHRAVQMVRGDYARYDYLIGMDGWNLRNMRRIVGGDPEGKLFRLLDFSENPRDVADPWMTRDFETAYQDILEGCTALLEYLMRNNAG